MSNDYALMSELKDTSLALAKANAELENLREFVRQVEFCSHQESCPECGYQEKHNPGGCKLSELMRAYGL
jgi:hypothetical protein